MLARQLRILLQIKELLQNEYPFISPRDPAIQQKIARELNLHPYVVSKALFQSKNFSIEKLKKLYEDLISTEIKLKTSNADPNLLLDLFIARVCL